MSATSTAELALEQATMRRVAWRLIPFLLSAYIVAIIDRVNVGFAALHMNKAVGIDPKTYGLGAGIFFVGYFILEVPSNLALERFGARKWIARIMITWGLVSGAFALIGGPTSFLALRFLLGAAEAGFFPGVILYLTYWFPAVYRAKIIGIFMVGIPIAGMIGSPLSGAVLGMDGFLGIAGWQWVFLTEAAPAVLLGFYAFFCLTDRPDSAAWLQPDQRAWLLRTLEVERSRTAKVAHVPILQLLGDKTRVIATLIVLVLGVVLAWYAPNKPLYFAGVFIAMSAAAWLIAGAPGRIVLLMALVYAGASGASTSLSLWMPTLVKSYGLTDFQTGLLNAVPFGIAGVLMIVWGRSSDKSGERVWHNALPLAWMVAALVATRWSDTLWTTIPLLTLIGAGTYASKGPFWALSSEWLGPAAAATGLAQINALGNLSSFFFNYLIGYIKEETGSFANALLPIAVVATLGTITILALGRNQPRTRRVDLPAHGSLHG